MPDPVINSTTFIDYLTSGSALIASLVALYGINTWRREYVGKKRMDLGHDLLEAFYKAKDAIRYIRSPFTPEIERSEAIKDLPEHRNEFDERAAVLSKRLNDKQKEIAAFRAMKYKIMAVFGNDSEKIFDEFASIPNQIATAMGILVKHYWNRQGENFRNKTEFENHLNEMNRFEGIIWDGTSEGDEILEKLNNIQSALEAIVHDHQDPIFKRIPKNLYAWIVGRLKNFIQTIIGQ
ncbi:MAG: hypothetical protein RI556_02255 [Hydrogenovibrio sp.]|uniref:hypothetical protein n=1 Tax=Hydrogenovibrio sp. TaxID=2065821 RepID=UPI0028709BF3|nr:hypothetical protein [Hydrogenovibrio sp.]MDR9497972.1 hypothetical protein [Hydrogenovibrio sp.]